MKEIKVFSSASKVSLVTEVNEFIKNNEYEVCDIQYGVSEVEYSVMLVLEVNPKES